MATPLQTYIIKKSEIIKKLMLIELPENKQVETCMEVGKKLGKSYNTIRNYLAGNVKDGYLGEAILQQFEINKK